MNINEYQARARVTAAYPGGGASGGFLYAALGLAAEAGESVNIAKKVLRGDYGPFDEAIKLVKPGLILELGDVLWYVAALASELGVSLEDIAEANLTKLAARRSGG